MLVPLLTMSTCVLQCDQQTGETLHDLDPRHSPVPAFALLWGYGRQQRPHSKLARSRIHRLHGLFITFVSAMLLKQVELKALLQLCMSAGQHGVANTVWR